ncbi:MAG: GNAT family N-acetyltransferase [Spirochaetia bacterium]|jgi:ribosomal protein S18 acetylase RimI-like enzyme|nr:GNAT family N-acetyltransferase [Spirochaetia bacterium]
MDFLYREATIEDLGLLTETRIKVLRAANGLDDSMDMPEVRKHTYAYYKKALADGSHVAYLVFDGDTVIGTGGVSFFRVMPTYHNQTGYKAYIMNMYTDQRYRRKGIASKVLGLLVKASLAKGIPAISLEATDMGRFLYKKFGFLKMDNEMELPNCR